MPSHIHHKLYIFGASGAGTTTLGQSIASEIGVVHVDSDDHFWAPVQPPFSVKRDPTERIASMTDALGDDGWILTGACNGWGQVLVSQATLIVFVHLPTPVRLERLVARESARFGDRIKAGGDMHQIHQDFLTWAQGYEDPAFDGRNLAAHERWLAGQTIPICRIVGTPSLEAAKKTVLDRLNAS